MNSFLTNPLVAFIRKNFVAVAVLAGAVALALAESAFGLLGQLAYAPVLIIALLLGVRILRHLSGWRTTAAYCDELVTEIKVWDERAAAYTTRQVGNFTTDFQALPPATKCWMVIIERGIALIAVATIIQHLWK